MSGDQTSWKAYLAFLSTPVDEARPFVLETGQAVSLHFDHLATQSFMSLRQPDRLVLPYTRAMMGFLLLQPAPRHIAMIGLGGGSLAKYCYRHLPQAKVTAIEINPEVIALRDTFRIPPDDARFEVLCADGADYIGNVGGEASPLDVILLDAFGADGMPERCTSVEFFAACRERLTEGGVLAINLGNDDPALPQQLARLESAFGASRSVFPVATGDNYLAFAWKEAQALPSRQVLFDRAHALAWARNLGLRATAQRLKEGECFDPKRLVWHEPGISHWKVPDWTRSD
ncbi:fused MFS/spermidine synthase [Paraburkholderia kururiensis]|uniref:fused MFS/spermidine synthase n=1 Tax=Paraburkholderia kururiensis TaxID=984307 RepID=UPI0003454395|nr:fused MFS/spermidine synthase [Paraburkholderia kururiensis]